MHVSDVDRSMDRFVALFYESGVLFSGK